MFEKTLTDVVKGIRASKRDTTSYISKCIAEIKEELKSPDLFVKANALQKLTFLQMMGYSMGYASFSTIEVMSSPRFIHKRIGYLAAVRRPSSFIMENPFLFPEFSFLFWLD
jgi:AP-3 complex subunit delta-1